MPPRRREATPAQRMNALAHRLRTAMAHGLRINVDAGSLSCVGRAVKMTNEPRSNVPEAESTLTVHINTGEQVVEVPLNMIREVTRP